MPFKSEVRNTKYISTIIYTANSSKHTIHIMELTNDISDALLLSAPQPDFEHDGDTFSNALLLHRLLATGQEEQVVSRRSELNRDLVKHTCSWGSDSKVRWSQIGARS